MLVLGYSTLPKHRSPGFAVVRERMESWCENAERDEWVTISRFDGVIGVYFTLQRAEEVAAATIQKYVDLGMDPNDPEYRCSVNSTNWYDE